MQLKKLHFPVLVSTNSWAKEHVESLDRYNLTVISAAQQTGGYGRFRHKWHSPLNKNLYISYVFFLDKRREDLCNVSQVLALSALKTLKDFRFLVTIKWPNDLILNGKKLGGLLCETTRCDQQLAVIVGIGLNINMTEEDLKEIDRPATSLFVENGEILDQGEILDKLSATFKEDLENFLKHGFHSFFDEFAQAILHQPGDVIRFHDYHKICTGKFEKINPDGSLSLQLENGKSHIYYSGELL